MRIPTRGSPPPRAAAIVARAHVKSGLGSRVPYLGRHIHAPPHGKNEPGTRGGPRASDGARHNPAGAFSLSGSQVVAPRKVKKLERRKNL
jgi:hypothetical protein